MYNYYDSMRSDILDYIADNFTLAEILDKLEEPDDWKESLNDDLWIDDGVTGNASGSYFFNSYKARECVIENTELCTEALKEFCVEAEEIGKRFLREDWEWMDVIIRCYILYGVVDSLVDALTECREALEAESEDFTAERLAEIIEAA